MDDNSNMFTLDWDETPETVDQNADHLPEGYLRVKLIEQKLDATKKDPTLEFKFHVSYGPLKGRFHSERLGIPKYIDNEEHRAIAEKRMKLFASRTGAIPKDTKGLAAPDWNKGVGQEYILEMVRKPDKKTGKVYTNMDFNGIWPIDHPTVQTFKNDVRARLGLPAIAGNDPKPGAANGAAGAAHTAAAAAGQPAGTVPVTAKQTVDQMANDIFN